MRSFINWVAQRDDAPRRTAYGDSSTRYYSSTPSSSAASSTEYGGGNESNGTVVPLVPTSSSGISRRPLTQPFRMDGVTYASKDDKRNVQFVCHLPPGSVHTAKAQQLAGVIYTGHTPPQQQTYRRVGASSDGGGRQHLITLGDEPHPGLRTTAARRDVLVDSPHDMGDDDEERGRWRPQQHRSLPMRDQPSSHYPPDHEQNRDVERVVVVTEDDDGDDDVGEIIQLPPPRRGMMTTNSQRGQKFVDHEDEDDDGRQYPYSPPPPTAPTALSAVRGGNRYTNSNSRPRGGIGGRGFRHQGATHTTYNIRNKDKERQLFVSAPSDSREAVVHSEIVSIMTARNPDEVSVPSPHVEASGWEKLEATKCWNLLLTISWLFCFSRQLPCYRTALKSRGKRGSETERY